MKKVFDYRKAGIVAVLVLIAVFSLIYFSSTLNTNWECIYITKEDLIASDLRVIDSSDHVALTDDYASSLKKSLNYKYDLLIQLVPANLTYKDYIEGNDYKHLFFLDSMDNFVDCRIS